jgi:hypothetical protein
MTKKAFWSIVFYLVWFWAIGSDMALGADSTLFSDSMNGILRSRTAENFREYRNTFELVLGIVYQYIQSPNVNISDALATSRQAIYPMMNNMYSPSSLYIGYETGQFYGYLAAANTTLGHSYAETRIDENGTLTLHQYDVGFDGTIIGDRISVRPYDCRTREWYLYAKKGSRLSPPYFDEVSKLPLVTLTLPIYTWPDDKLNETAELIGFAGADVYLTELSDFIFSLHNREVPMYFMTGDYKLLGTALQHVDLWTENTTLGEPQLVYASDSTNTFIAQATQKLIMYNFPTQPIDTTIKGKRLRIYSTPVNRSIFVHLLEGSEDDLVLTAPSNYTTIAMVWLALGLLLAFGSLSFLFKYREDPVVQQSRPQFLYVIIFGMLLQVLMNSAFFGERTTVICWIALFAPISICMLLVPLFLLSRELYIYHSEMAMYPKQVPRAGLTGWQIWLISMGYASFIIVYKICYEFSFGYADNGPETKVYESADGAITEYKECRITHGRGALSALPFYSVFLVVFYYLTRLYRSSWQTPIEYPIPLRSIVLANCNVGLLALGFFSATRSHDIGMVSLVRILVSVTVYALVIITLIVPLAQVVPSIDIKQQQKQKRRHPSLRSVVPLPSMDEANTADKAVASAGETPAIPEDAHPSRVVAGSPCERLGNGVNGVFDRSPQDCLQDQHVADKSDGE